MRSAASQSVKGRNSTARARLNAVWKLTTSRAGAGSICVKNPAIIGRNGNTIMHPAARAKRLPSGRRRAACEPASRSAGKVLPRLAPSTSAKDPAGATTPEAANEPISRTTATLEWHAQVNAAAISTANIGSPPNEPSTARRAEAFSTGSNVWTSDPRASSISPRPMPARPRFLLRPSSEDRKRTTPISTRIGATCAILKAKIWVIRVLPRLAPSMTARAGARSIPPLAANDVTISPVAVLLCKTALDARGDHVGAPEKERDIAAELQKGRRAGHASLSAADCDAGREERRQGRDRTVHQPGETGLMDLQKKEPPLGFALLLLDLARHVLCLELLRPGFVTALFGCEVAEELADGGVGRLPRRPLVEALALRFHQLCLGTHFFEAERPCEPQRLALEKAFHVLPADQRDVVAELLAVEVEEAVTVTVLLGRHRGEHSRRSGIALARRIREVAVGTAVLLLESDGERQQLLLRQIREVLHRSASLPSLISAVGRSWASAASGRLSVEIRRGQSDPGSSPCSTQPRSRAQTLLASRHRHRPPRGLAAGSANRK